MGYAIAPTHSPGETLPSADWNVLANDINSGLMRMLADTTLGVAAASIDFISIPATFAHLRLVIYARGDNASLNVGVNVRLNNDGGTNYQYGYINSDGGAVTTSEAYSQAQIVAGIMPGSTAFGGAFGETVIDLAQYVGTVGHKALICHTGGLQAAVGPNQLNLRTTAARWTGTAAVNRITAIANAGNFIAGTRATLYGLPS